MKDSEDLLKQMQQRRDKWQASYVKLESLNEKTSRLVKSMANGELHFLNEQG